jgi:hypothetical protein
MGCCRVARAGRVMPYIFDPPQNKRASLAQGFGRAGLSAGVRAPVLVEKISLRAYADADCKSHICDFPDGASRTKYWCEVVARTRLSGSVIRN